MDAKFHKNTNLQVMMLNIALEGREEIWMNIEEEKDPWKRVEKRKIFTKALKELNTK